MIGWIWMVHSKIQEAKTKILCGLAEYCWPATSEPESETIYSPDSMPSWRMTSMMTRKKTRMTKW